MVLMHIKMIIFWQKKNLIKFLIITDKGSNRDLSSQVATGCELYTVLHVN